MDFQKDKKRKYNVKLVHYFINVNKPKPNVENNNVLINFLRNDFQLICLKIKIGSKKLKLVNSWINLTSSLCLI